jgi:hypothetical protein
MAKSSLAKALGFQRKHRPDLRLLKLGSGL